MNTNEFDTWLDHHEAALPAFAKWCSNQGERHPKTMDIWRGTLSDITLAEAIAATSAIVRGDITCFHSDLPAVIRNHAFNSRNVQASTAVEEDPRGWVRCKHCRDTGRRLCWAPAALERRLNEDPKFKHQQCLFACKCQAGDPYRHPDRKDQVGTFNDYSCEYDIDLTRAENEAKLDEHLAGFGTTVWRDYFDFVIRNRAIKPATVAHSEFDDWNNQ